MAETSIRLAVPGDEDSLAELNSHVQALHVAARPDFFKPTESEALRGWFAERLSEPSTRVWLAERDGMAIGYLLAIFRESPESVFCFARRWCEVDQVSVAPEHRRQGVAQRLVEAALAAARADAVTQVELASWCFNSVAQTSFRELGFRPKVTRFEFGQSLE
jgi:GNAT superfamily N-acetyltransferase